MQQHSISLEVANVAQAILFYTRALGCTLLRSGCQGSAAQIRSGNIVIDLLEAEAANDPGSPGTTVARWTPLQLACNTEQWSTLMDRIVRLGGKRSQSQPYRAMCSDPFGNVFCLFAAQTSAAATLSQQTLF